jgi:hypothetical protein
LAQLYIAERGHFGHDADVVMWLKTAGSNWIGEAYRVVGVMYLEGKPMQ